MESQSQFSKLRFLPALAAVLLFTFFALATAAPQRSVKRAHPNLALIPCACGREYEARNFWPVCGSDGITYSNSCEFKCYAKQIDGLKLAYEGECKDGDLMMIN